MALTVVNGPIIAAGESLSDGIDCTVGTLVRITMPASWTPANLTFQLSSDGAFFNDLFDADGREITMVVTPGAAVVLTDMDWTGKAAIAHLKFRSGTRAYPVLQDEQREFAVAIQS
jgi:hypothetical protein